VPAAVLVCLIVLLVLGLAERLARDRAWRAVPIRIHVNGSRGKSTVTRLIWAALREAGIPALGKTTGTSPRLLLPDGTERVLRRWAPASIREQLAFVRRARRLGARAIVVECMALDPELQWISEREMVGASIGVITNVRLDHTEVMGGDLDAIAATLANTVPRRGVLVLGDARGAAFFRDRAARLGTRVVTAEPAATAAGPRRPVDSRPDPLPRWLQEDTCVALAVTRQLGIDDATASRGFAAAPLDPGAASSGTASLRGRSLPWLDATAANDPESLAVLLGGADGRRKVLVYNHRADRGSRLVTFARHAPIVARAQRVIVTGARPAWTAWRVLRRARGSRPTDFATRGALARRLRDLPADTEVVFCGNTRGFDLPGVLHEMSADD
jgi:poly-gamma-glutamate synthase PgsB/CapB